jgi:hypothetical protein
MSLAHLAPGCSACATIPLRQLPAVASMQPLTLPGTAVSRPYPRGAAPDLAIALLGGPPGWPMGIVTTGQPGGPAGKMMLSAEKTGKSPFKTRFDTGMLLEKPGHKMPQGGRQRAGSGVGPRQRRLPPTVPGAPLRLSHRPQRRRPVPLVRKPLLPAPGVEAIYPPAAHTITAAPARLSACRGHPRPREWTP